MLQLCIYVLLTVQQQSLHVGMYKYAKFSLPIGMFPICQHYFPDIDFADTAHIVV